MTVIGSERPAHLRFKFTIEIDGFTHVGFQKMGELSQEVAEVAYYEGGSVTPLKLPGRVTVADVELSRGAGLDHDFYNWAKEVIDVVSGGGLIGGDYKRQFDLVQRDRDGSEIHRWNCTGAWPKKFVAGEWDNDADEVVIQSLTLAIDAFRLVQ